MVHVGNKDDILCARTVHRFEPNRLPEASGGRVHDAAWIKGLFAARLAPVIDGIIDLDNQFLWSAACQIRGYVVAEWVVAALVRANALAIDINL